MVAALPFGGGFHVTCFAGVRFYVQGHCALLRVIGFIGAVTGLTVNLILGVGRGLPGLRLRAMTGRTRLSLSADRHRWICQGGCWPEKTDQQSQANNGEHELAHKSDPF